MCGISGYLTIREKVKPSLIRRTLDLMKRRGPDNQSFFKKDYSNKEIGLLHSRLNIIDLDKRSNQPFYGDNTVMVFNGEIYNFLELRKILEKKNYKFKTSSDTEVLLKSYTEWGESCVDFFVGMWAFAIWDQKKKKLFLSRDNFGEKPLYYTFENNAFYFGSEIKFIKSLSEIKFRLNKNKIYKYLSFGYKSINNDNNTFYKNVHLLENATNITVDLNLKFIKKKYWRPKLKINNSIDAETAASHTRFLVKKSLDFRMRSDVPIAFCLSGGIDSGFLYSAASIKQDNIKSFSIIDSDKRYNESENINLLLNKNKAQNIKINIKNKNKNFFNMVNYITKYQDAPISTISYYVHSLLCKEINKNNYRIAISGTGADELFTGYYDHFLLQLATINKTHMYKKKLNDWKSFIKPIIRNKFLKKYDYYIKDPNSRNLVYETDFNLNKFIKKKNLKIPIDKNYTTELLRNRMMNELFHEVVPTILKDDDHNSMNYSIENRSPYLDKDLLGFALTIPPSLLISEGYQKKVLRDASKNILPNKIRLDRQKRGFNASISSLVDLKKKENIDHIFNDKSLINEFVNLKKLKDSINFNDIPNHHSKLIFSILTTEAFLKSNL